MKVWADILNEEFSPKGYKIPTDLESDGKTIASTKIDNARMRNVLGIVPRDFKSTIIDMAYAALQNKLVQVRFKHLDLEISGNDFVKHIFIE